MAEQPTEDHVDRILGGVIKQVSTDKGDAYRPSYEEYKRLKNEVKSNLLKQGTIVRREEVLELLGPVTVTRLQLTPEQISVYKKNIMKALSGLSNFELAGQDFLEALITTELLGHGMWIENTSQESGGEDDFATVDDQPTRYIADIANHLIYAVGFAEGRIPPNESGFIPDESVSLMRKDEIIRENFSTAHLYISGLPKDLLPLSEKNLLKTTYNSAVSRIEPSRILYKTYSSEPASIPLFPSS